MDKYNVIGVMSGTSLDGLDIAFCRFYKEKNKWKFKIEKAETIPYANDTRNFLKGLESATAVDLASANMNYGKFIGEKVKIFIKKNKIKLSLVSSHGHTLFHQPSTGYTFQLGSGASIAAECNFPVACDFRTMDVAMGGQGAPLVPIGDQLLFSEYDFCLNLGGFANISFEKGKKRIAFDICPVNIVLNFYAEKTGKNFDDKGRMARTGRINAELLNELNELEFYKIKHGKPSSLGKEWVVKFVYPLLGKYNLSVEDSLCTFTEHTAIQIASRMNNKRSSKVLVTGGGAYNRFLMERLKALSVNEFVLPADEIINFKEALIFAFLGVLRLRGENNSLKSVTGSKKDNIGGCIYVV